MANRSRDYQIGSGNVFEDLELPDAPELQVKARLAYKISNTITKLELTQSQAAARLGIDQPKVSALLRGHLERFSIERLCSLLTALGQDVSIRVRPARTADRGTITADVK